MEEKLFRKGTFEFVGNIMEGKELVSTNTLGTSEWKKTRLNIGIKNDNNLQFLNIEYMHSDKVKTAKLFDKDGNGFDVKLEETYKPETIEKVPEYNRIIVDMETDFEKKKEYVKLMFKKRNHEFKEEQTYEDLEKIKEYSAQIKELATNRLEFVHMKDVIKFLEANMPNIKDKKIKVVGVVKSNYYKGKNNLQYIPERIEIVENETANQLKVYLDLFYEKDSIDDDTKQRKMFINGYVGERIKKQDKLFPLTVVVDYTKVDDTNEQHQLLLTFMKNIFQITDKKQMHKIGLELNVINGAEVVEFDESCLTDNQKMGIQLGLNTIDDFKPKGNTYGSRIQELKVAKSDLKNYPNGSVEVFKAIDLGDYLVADDSDKSLSDVKNDTKEETKTEQTTDTSTTDLMAQLFGN